MTYQSWHAYFQLNWCWSLTMAHTYSGVLADDRYVRVEATPTCKAKRVDVITSTWSRDPGGLSEGTKDGGRRSVELDQTSPLWLSISGTHLWSIQLHSIGYDGWIPKRRQSLVHIAHIAHLKSGTCGKQENTNGDLTTFDCHPSRTLWIIYQIHRRDWSIQPAADQRGVVMYTI